MRKKVIKFTEEEFLKIIKESKSHREASKKLGYKSIAGVKTCKSKYAQFLQKLNPDTSHFHSSLTESQFLSAIKSSKSHQEAGEKLGYSKVSIENIEFKYTQFFKRLNPVISHFVSRFTDIEYNIPYKSGTKEYRREYTKIREKYDIKYKLTRTLRTRLRVALKQNNKSGSAVKDLGCSIEKFELWLEMHWEEGMSWENYGKWHIDHTIPLAHFDLENRKDVVKACHFSNLKPMWKEQNLRKSDKIL